MQFLAENRDYILFIFLVLLAQGVVALFLRWRQAPVPLATPLLVAAVLLLGVPFVLHAGSKEKTRLTSLLIGYASTYAKEAEYLGHALIPLPPAPDDPRYMELIRAEIRWLSANKVVSDIYTMRWRDDGAVVFLADSETDYDGNGQYDADREGRTTPGEVYPVPTTGMIEAFAGATTFSTPYTDKWGSWVSACTPLRDATGRIEGMLGVDYPAEHWLVAVARARFAAICVTGIIVLTLLAAGSIAAILRARVAESLAFAARLEEGRNALITLNQQLETLSLTDALTEVCNRRAFNQALEAELAKARRGGVPLSLLLIDIDHFKSFNDEFGHPAGDEALRRVAAILEKNARLYDLVARYGGEEFAVILYGAGREETMVIAGRLRAAVEAAEWPQRPITISIGAATTGSETKSEELLTATDGALYRAKQTGRNRVVHSDV